MIRNGWYICPHCGKKLVRVRQGAVSKGVFIKCKERNCGKQVEIIIEPLSR